MFGFVGECLFFLEVFEEFDGLLPWIFERGYLGRRRGTP